MTILELIEHNLTLDYDKLYSEVEKKLKDLNFKDDNRYDRDIMEGDLVRDDNDYCYIYVGDDTGYKTIFHDELDEPITHLREFYMASDREIDIFQEKQYYTYCLMNNVIFQLFQNGVDELYNYRYDINNLVNYFSMTNINTNRNLSTSIINNNMNTEFLIADKSKLLKLKEDWVKIIKQGNINNDTTRKLATSIFKNNVCFGTGKELNLISDYQCSDAILIHFPKIEVRNNKLKENITDVYIKLILDEKGHLESFQGCVTTMTIEQYESNYTQSHLSTGNLGEWGNWCLGATDLSTTVAQLTHEYNPLLMEAFFYRLEDYLSWESLKGGPYRRIENISLKNSNIPYATITDHDTNYIISKLTELPLRVYKNKFYNSIVIDKDNEDFETQLGKILYDYTNASCYFVWKDFTNHFIIGINNRKMSQIKQEIDNINEDKKGIRLFTFNEVDIAPKIRTVIKLTGEESFTRVLNPTAYEKLCRDINKKLQDYVNYKTIVKNYELKQEKQKETKQEQSSTDVNISRQEGAVLVS